MARWKPGPDAPATSQRINGDVYDYSTPTPNLRTWHSPRESPSRRFDFFDATARLADFDWNDLDTPSKQNWTDRAQTWVDTPGPICLPKRPFTTCDIKQPYHDGTEQYPTPGQSYHRAVYIENTLDGTTPPTLPPIDEWQWQQPSYDFHWNNGPWFTYSPSTEHAQPTLTLAFFVRSIPDPTTHMVKQAARWKFIARKIATDNVPVSIAAEWAAWAAAQSRTVLQLMITAAEIGDAPYVRWWANTLSDAIYIDNYPSDPP